MTNIAVFASGSGSNAENIIRHFSRAGLPARVSLVVCDRRGAGVIERARRLGTEVMIVEREIYSDGHALAELLEARGIGFIALAGYLRMVPSELIRRFGQRIVNIHPSLLPRHGGKGMYGMNIHRAVIAAGDTETGITIHHVSDEIDGGGIIFQARMPVGADDTPESVESRIHNLEALHYPAVIERILTDPGELLSQKSE